MLCMRLKEDVKMPSKHNSRLNWLVTLLPWLGSQIGKWVVTNIWIGGGSVLFYVTECVDNICFKYRVLQVAKQETENSEDPGYIRKVEEASDHMASTVAPMVDSAKSLAKNITHPGRVADWRKNNTVVSHPNTLLYQRDQYFSAIF